MNFRQKLTLSLLLYIVLCPPLFAEVVDIPDPNLRAAIQDALQLRPNDPIPVESMRRITNLKIPKRNIQSLEGLQFATRLESLDVAENHISNFSPLSNLVNLDRLIATKNGITDLTTLGNLTQLRRLSLSSNPITDIRPLANLVNLERLGLSWCETLVDIRPLANLTRLKVLSLHHNKIKDVTPLANLHNLEVLNISHNLIADHSPLDNLPLDHFVYDQSCDIPPEPLEPRLENRSFPSIFAAFLAGLVNRSDLDSIPDYWDRRIANGAEHDLFFSSPDMFSQRFMEIESEWHLRGLMPQALDRRDRYFALNPNMIFIAEVRMRDSGDYDAFPDDHPYWIRDADYTTAYFLIGGPTTTRQSEIIYPTI